MGLGIPPEPGCLPGRRLILNEAQSQGPPLPRGSGLFDNLNFNFFPVDLFHHSISLKPEKILDLEKTSLPPDWEDILKTCSGSIFQSSEWLDAVVRKPYEPVYLVFSENGVQKAFMAGIETNIGQGELKKLFFYSGIISRKQDPELLRQCMEKLLDFARKNSYFQIIIKSYDHLRNQPSGLKEFSPFQRAEFVIDLTLPTEQLIHQTSSDIRRRARKAKREGSVFKFGYSENLLQNLFRLLENTRQVRARKGYGKYHVISMPFLTPEVMLKLLASKDAVINYIEKDGEILSMNYILTAGGRAYVLQAGSSPSGYKYSAPALLAYETMLKCKSEDFDILNWGGVPLGKQNKGLKKFKLDLGARIVESHEEATLFLMPPLTKYNMFIRLKKSIIQLPAPWLIKKILLKTADHFLKGKDHY